MTIEFKDLLEVIGIEHASDHGYCNQPTTFKQFDKGAPYYWTWEKDVVIPRLKSLGYTVMGDWHTGDGDSFGPLTRYICVVKDGKLQNLIYG